LKTISNQNEEMETKFLELRALRNRARKRRANKELIQAKQLYSQAIEVAKELNSEEDVDKLKIIVLKIELDMLIERLHKIEQGLMDLGLNN